MHYIPDTKLVMTLPQFLDLSVLPIVLDRNVKLEKYKKNYVKY